MQLNIDNLLDDFKTQESLEYLFFQHCRNCDDENLEEKLASFSSTMPEIQL